MSGQRNSRELASPLARCRTAFLGVAVMSGLINVLYRTGSFFMLEVYDRVIPSRSVPTLIGLMALALLLYAFQGALEMLRSRILARVGAALDEALSARVFDLVVHVSLPVLVACLALPAAALAQPAGLDRGSRSVDAGLSGNSDKLGSLITVKNASGAPGEFIPLSVTVSVRPGQSLSNTYLVGLPKGARLATDEDTFMATDEKAAIDVTQWDLPRLSVMLPPTQAGTYTLAVVAVSRPDNGEPTNFTSSTFTLKATAESREGEPAVETSAPGARRPDAVLEREALPQPFAMTLVSNNAMQDGGISSKITTQITEVVRPKALVNLWHEETYIADSVPRAIAAPNQHDLSPAVSRPAAAPAAPTALAAHPTTAPAAIAPPPNVVPPAVAPAAARAAPAMDADGKALVERAERLIRLGDISGARLVLERASDRGDPRATFLLAQTCDPRMLREWKVQGLKPDPDRARALYAKAAQEGVRETRPVTDARR